MNKFLIVLIAATACGSSSSLTSPSPDLAAATDAGGFDASLDPSFDAAMDPDVDGGDGTPTRQQCTNKWGTALSATHGRLDGYLVSIVAPGATQRCNDDDSHVHLQVMMEGSIYDVAVDTGATGDEIYYLAKDFPLAGGAWSEGWHTSDALSYASLGVKSADLTELDPTTAATTVENALASVNHISVYGTGYNSHGMHLIHYQSGSGQDGALVLEPESETPRFLFFRFASDKF